ncbi:hypothetical protein RUND412_001862 [Rhizina undulata]
MTTRRLRFAPLNPEIRPHPDSPSLQGVVFDVDGTLCEPQTWMFARMRATLGITKSVDILEHIYSLPSDEQPTAMESVRDIEREAMAQMVPQRGLVELMEYLQSKGVRKAICTRNFEIPVNHLITNFLNGHVFDPIVTREFRPSKPDPAGILHIAREWRLEDGGSRLIMVGDSIDDMTAGRRAGAATVLLANDVNKYLVDHEHTDYVVERLEEIIPILENGFTEINGTKESGETEENDLGLKCSREL